MTILSHTLDAGGSAGAAGDLVCKAASSVVRATAANLATYGFVYGCLRTGGNPGATVEVIVDGVIPPALSGLAAVAGKARVNTTTARAERVASLSGSDYPIGDIDSTGHLDFTAEPESAPTKAAVKAISTPKHGAYVYCTEKLGPYLFDALDSTAADDDDILASSDGSRGRWRLRSFAPLDADEWHIAPGASVATIDATLAAASTQGIASGRKVTVRFPAGVFLVGASEALRLARSKVAVEGAGAGRTIIRASTSPDVGLADDRTNNLTYGAGVDRSDILNTVLTTTSAPGGVAYYGAGSRKFSVNSLGTLQAGMWVAVGGTDVVGQSPGGQSGENFRSRELMRVSSLQTSPNRITPEWSTKQHHSINRSGPGGTGEVPYVRAVEPVVDFEIRGLTFEATAHAVGLRLDDCAHGVLEDVEFKGFSRSPFEAFGCLDLWGRDIRIESSNGGIYLRSVNVADFQFETAVGGLATHANGYHRAALHVEHGCTFVKVHDSHVRNRVKAFDWRGVAGGCETIGCTAEDIDFHLLTNPPPNTSGVKGAALDTGSGEGPDDEHSFGLLVRGFRARNIRHSSAAGANIDDLLEGAICLHDTVDLDVEAVIEAGLSDQTTLDGDANYRTFGWVAQDASGRIAIKTIGVEFGGCVRSVAGRTVIDGCDHTAAPGSGANSTVALVLYWGSNVEIRNCFHQGYLWFGSPYGSNPLPYQLEVTGWYSMDGEPVSGPLRVCTFSGATANNGSVWALDSTAAGGATKCKVPAADGDHIVVAHGRNNLSGWGNGAFGLFGAVGQGRMLVSGAGSAGDTVDFALGSSTPVATGGTTIGARTIARLAEAKGAGTALAKVERVR